ncbi:hypothetical protein [Spirosoma koreense]
MPIDHRRYPPYWKQLSTYVRFERAGGRCENCGATHGEPHPVTGKKVKLQCAHLNRTPERTKESELMALCARCHFAYDRADNQAKRLYGRNYKQQQLDVFGQNSPSPVETGCG